MERNIGRRQAEKRKKLKVQQGQNKRSPNALTVAWPNVPCGLTVAWPTVPLWPHCSLAHHSTVVATPKAVDVVLYRHQQSDVFIVAFIHTNANALMKLTLS